MAKGKQTKSSSCCDTCSNYVYDEEYEYYTCEMNLDEDEMGKFMTDSFYDCPYYQYDDEYAIEIARDKLNYHLPGEIIFYNGRSD